MSFYCVSTYSTENRQVVGESQKFLLVREYCSLNFTSEDWSTNFHMPKPTIDYLCKRLSLHMARCDTVMRKVANRNDALVFGN